MFKSNTLCYQITLQWKPNKPAHLLCYPNLCGINRLPPVFFYSFIMNLMLKVSAEQSP